MLAILLGSTDDPPKGDIAKADRETLQGTWAMVEWVDDGDSRGPIIAVTRMTIEGDRFRYWRDTERSRYLDDTSGTFTLEATKSPKAIDLRYTFPDDVNTLKSLGIYEVDGDTLRIASCGIDRGVRPTAFAAPKGSQVRFCVYRRVKPQPPAEPAKPK